MFTMLEYWLVWNLLISWRYSHVQETLWCHALSLTPRSPTLHCLWHRGVSLSIVFDTVESASALSLTPRSRSQHHCLWHRGVRLCSINDITESNKMSVIKRGSVTRILTLYFHDFDLWLIVSTFVHISP